MPEQKIFEADRTFRNAETKSFISNESINVIFFKVCFLCEVPFIKMFFILKLMKLKCKIE